MEGIGSRLGRVSSRYGPTASVLNGRVRKWKKKWVDVSSSSTVSYRNSSQSQSNRHKLLLCRWIPIPPTTVAEAEAYGGSGDSDEPPRRKCRYTPIVVLDEHINTAAKKIKDEIETTDTNHSSGKTTVSDGMQGKPNINEVFRAETEESEKLCSPRDANNSLLDLGLRWNGQNRT